MNLLLIILVYIIAILLGFHGGRQDWSIRKSVALMLCVIATNIIINTW